VRYFKAAVALGLLGALLLTVSVTLHRQSVRNLSREKARLAYLTTMAGQTAVYEEKLESVKKTMPKLELLAAGGSAQIDYEISMTDNDLSRLMEKTRDTYADGIFFLESAVAESTSFGISVTMKGFKLGGNP